MNRNYKSHTYFNGHIRNTKNLEELSQEIDVDGKLMIPPTPKTSSNVTLVTLDNYIHPQIAKFINKYGINYLEALR